MNKYILLFLTILAFNTNALQILKNEAELSLTKKPLKQDSLQQIELMAKSGNIDAQFKLANMYHAGNKVEKDDKLAFYWYKQVANKGYASAQFNIANSYYNGIGVEKNINKSIAWYEKAAKQGLISAIYNLAIIFEIDKKDYKSSFFWYKKAAALKDGLSQLSLAKMYESGIGIGKDTNKAQNWFVRSIDNNAFDGEYYFAKFLIKNNQIKKAIKMYNQGASKGSFLSQYDLAILNLEGKLVKKDKKLAIELATKAANQEYSPAQELLGYIYNSEKNQKKSIFWYARAAENGSARAQYSLGVFYLKGLGVKKDIYKSTAFFIKAADQGYVNAQYSLALRYLGGDGIEQNNHEAVKWLMRAAKQNHSLSQLALSVRYKLGQGVKKDQKQRVFWLTKASENSNKNAQYELAALTLLNIKTKFSIQEAKTILENFVKKGGALSAKSNYVLGKYLLKTKLKEVTLKNIKPKIVVKKDAIKKELPKNSIVENKKLNNVIEKSTKKLVESNLLKGKKIINNNIAKKELKAQQEMPNELLKNTQFLEKIVANYPIESMYRLAIMYLNGSYVEKDYKSAFYLMQKTSLLGFLPAQNDLALMYFNGIGVKADYQKAYNLALSASQAGYEPANKTLMIIKNKIK